jgi:hypothetical protein
LKIKLIQRVSPHTGWQLQGGKDAISLQPLGARKQSVMPIDGQVETMLAKLLTICQVCPADVLVVCSADQVSSLADGVLALFAARHWRELLGENGEPHDVVLVHAFPVAFLDAIFSHTRDHLQSIVQAAQLSLLARQQLTLVDTVGVPRSEIERKHRRVILKNRRLLVRRTGSVSELLSDWRGFCDWRFGQKLESEHLDLLKELFCNPGFTVKEFWLSGQCVARSLIYVDLSQRVLFDVLAPWSRIHAHHRLGVYTAVNNLLEAHEHGLRYCLCYGQFAYKRAIIGDLPVSTFQ